MKMSHLRKDIPRIHIGRVALEDSVGQEQQPVARLQLQLLNGILGVGCYAKREARGQTNGLGSALTEQDRHGMPGVHDTRDSGGMIDAHDLPGHKPDLPGKLAQRLIGQPGLFLEIDTAAASVSQCAHQNCCEHGRAQRVAHRICDREVQGISLDAEVERVSADVACRL
jgi:hypothetical protein